jgi:hypothetical protein
MQWPPAIELSELDSGVVTVTEPVPLPGMRARPGPEGTAEGDRPARPSRWALTAGWRAYAIGALALVAVGEGVIIGLQQRTAGLAVTVAPPEVRAAGSPAAVAGPASVPAAVVPVVPPQSSPVSVPPAVAAPAALAVAPGVGWVALDPGVDVDVWVGSRRLGAAGEGRFELAAGEHQLELVNDRLGVRLIEPVRIVRGRVTTLSPVLPRGVLHLNATPWAEVLLNGQPLGTTPLANVSAPLGDHVLVFRHPELGTRTVGIHVTAGEPTRASVNMREPQE